MKLRQLGKSDVYVSSIAFGAWTIGGWAWGGADENAGIDAVRTAYGLGITTFDTAPIYGFGRSEKLVGKAMNGIPRDRYQLLTKFGLNWESENGEFYTETQDGDGNPVNIYKWATKERVKQECENSLKRLGTEFIDLYQIHWPDKGTPVSETMEALVELKDEGKIRAAGVCNYSTDLVEEALGTIDLATNQVPYSMINRKNEKDVIPQALQKGIHILPYSPLQRGLLTGKIKPGHTFSNNDTRKDSRFFTEENIRKANELLDNIKPIAEKHNASFAQLAINWTSRQEGVGCVLAGARNKRQVRDNAGALDFELTPEEVSSIKKAAEELFPLV